MLQNKEHRLSPVTSLPLTGEGIRVHFLLIVIRFFVHIPVPLHVKPGRSTVRFDRAEHYLQAQDYDLVVLSPGPENHKT